MCPIAWDTAYRQQYPKAQTQFSLEHPPVHCKQHPRWWRDQKQWSIRLLLTASFLHQDKVGYGIRRKQTKLRAVANHKRGCHLLAKGQRHGLPARGHELGSASPMRAMKAFVCCAALYRPG